MMESDLLYSKSTGFNVNHIKKLSLQQHLEWCLTEYLGIIT